MALAVGFSGGKPTGRTLRPAKGDGAMFKNPLSRRRKNAKDHYPLILKQPAYDKYPVVNTAPMPAGDPSTQHQGAHRGFVGKGVSKVTRPSWSGMPRLPMGGTFAI